MSGFDANIESEFKTSKINSAGLINLRMNKLWGMADMCSVRADMKNLYLILETIWRSLAADTKDEKYKDKYKLMIKELEDRGFFNLYIEPKGFNSQIIISAKDRAFYYQKLGDIHIFLKELENEQGKGTAYYDPLDDNFD